MARITASVAPGGACTIDFEGFAGQSCQAAAAQLRALLAEFGVQLTDEQITLKPELPPAQARLSAEGERAGARSAQEGETA